MKCLPSVADRPRQEHHRAHFGMAPRNTGGLRDAAAPACHANSRGIHAGLSEQRSERAIDICRPRVSNELNRIRPLE